MRRSTLLVAAIAACDPTAVDVSPRRDAAADEAAARPPRDDSGEVALGAVEPTLVKDTEARCNYLDDDGDGLVDEGFTYEFDDEVSELLTPGHTPIELRALAAHGDGAVAVAQGGFWDTRSPLLAVHFDRSGAVVRNHDLLAHQPSRAFPACAGGSCVVFGQQRPIGCPTQPERCAVFAWRVPPGATGSRTILEPPTPQTLGGPAVLGGRVWVPLTRPRDDGGEMLALVEWHPDGSWGTPRSIHTVGHGERVLSVRGVSFEDRVAWVYATERMSLEAVVTDAQGTPAPPVVLSPQGQLIDDSPATLGRLGDTLFALFTVSGRGIVLGRWSMTDTARQRPVLVARSGGRYALAAGHGQVIVISNGPGNGSLVQRYAPDGRLLQMSPAPQAVGEDRALIAGARGFRYASGMYYLRRLVTASLHCPGE